MFYNNCFKIISISFYSCDADPAALAKYVYALVKKDKTLEELRGGMVEQLDVFLQQGTFFFFKYKRY